MAMRCPFSRSNRFDDCGNRRRHEPRAPGDLTAWLPAGRAALQARRQGRGRYPGGRIRPTSTLDRRAGYRFGERSLEYQEDDRRNQAEHCRSGKQRAPIHAVLTE